MLDLLARLRARLARNEITQEQCYHAWTLMVSALNNELSGE